MYDGCCPFPVKLAPFTAIPAWAEGFTALAIKILSCAETHVNSMQVWETSGAGGEAVPTELPTVSQRSLRKEETRDP